LREQLALLPAYLTAHLQLTLIALAIGFAVSVPAGVWASRRARVERLVLGAAGVLQTIPSLALLAVMVPALALLGSWTEAKLGAGVPSIGFPPAIIALSLYSLLPMLRNTVAGLAGVEPSLVEAARAVGMTPRQRLLRVELPLAAPVIVAGVRTATVWVVGTATLSTPVGATSLGNYIFSGLQTRNFNAVLVGCVAAALLALLLDGLIRLLETGVGERRPGLVGGCLAVLGGLYMFVGVTLAAGGARGDGAPAIRIGAKTFTEQYILGEVLARQIERRTGADSRALPSLGSTVAFDALRAGEIDLYVDYTGTIWATLMGRVGESGDRQEVLEEVERFLDERHGVVSLGALGFENAYALAVRGDWARETGVSTIADLTPRSRNLRLGADYEFLSRPEWQALESTYGLEFGDRRSMDPSLMYEALEQGEVDVISAFSTDGRIAADNLRLLVDERQVIPPYDAIVLAREEWAGERPEVVSAIRELIGRIDQRTMQRLNRSVDQDGETPATVAARYLETWP
jgi:osmoprotectant transport system permease protein